MSISLSSESLAKRAIEDAGFEVHNANIVFRSNCPNIDLIVYGKEKAIYVQVKSSKKPASKDHVTIDGSPWNEAQLYNDGAIYNKHDSFSASFVVIVDLEKPGDPSFYIAPPYELAKLVREKGVKWASTPKRDGSSRSLGFRKELPRENLKQWLNAWELLGEPLRSAPTS
jgi:hypothetical protein